MSGLEQGLEFRERMEKQRKLVDSQMKGYPLDRIALLKSRIAVHRLTDEEVVKECKTLKSQIDSEASGEELDAVMEHL